MTIRRGDRVNVTGGEHRGVTGRVAVDPTPDGIIYVRVRLSPTEQALLAVRVDDVVRLDSD